MTATERAIAAMAVVVALAGTTSVAAQSAPPDGGVAAPLSTFLSAFPVEAHLSRSLFAPGGARVTLRFDPVQSHQRGSNELMRRLRLRLSEDGRLVFDTGAYPSTSERPSRQHLRPSFVLDFDQPVFQAILADIRAQLGTTPRVEELARYVSRFIAKKGMGRAFDIASVVARRREGDCTEHAVLLAAIARAFRFPARVVSGLVLVEPEGNPASFGHAWVEVYRGGRWQPADAALLGGLPVVYLPLELQDEGPSFELSIVKTSLGTLGVRGISVADR
jgi:transglutaminase-like putative cysteine protease